MYARVILLACLLLSPCLKSFADDVEGFTTENRGCPVSFSASRDGASAHPARRGQRSTHAASIERIEVRLAGATLVHVVEVSGGIYGISDVPHITHSSSGAPEMAATERLQTFTLSGFRREDPTSDWKLDVTCVPVVQGIYLSEIRMSDGTAWHESEHSHCRAAAHGSSHTAQGKAR